MKVERSIELIQEAAKDVPCAFLCSFGKDSMVLAHLIMSALPRRAMGAHWFPVPVIFHRHPWFPHKFEFAERIARTWAMEVHDWLPMHAGIKTKTDMLELVVRYNFGDGILDIPINTLPPISRRDYLCGLNDWVLRPKGAGTSHSWKTVFHGHKSSDVDPFEGHVPLNASATFVGGIRVVFPLRDWTDDDVWHYIEEHRVPYQKNRYADRKELDDKWANPDYVNACTACIDPRCEDEEVFCPKLRANVPNVGNWVMRLQVLPDYIGTSNGLTPR
jgi:3'-phosphoadenosine 5'-phosphosulfate sulfotransferase (PAPS reductase)/FAD synthetase